jgi:hypothetical protein
VRILEALALDAAFSLLTRTAGEPDARLARAIRRARSMEGESSKHHERGGRC